MAGRSRKAIDLEELEHVGELLPTQEELASHFNVSVDTIARRLKEPRFATAFERGRAKGKVALRRKQMEMAMKGNVPMLIFLGKNILGQSDHPEPPDDNTQALAELVDAIKGAALKYQEQNQ